MSERRGLALGAAAYLAWGLLSPGNEILLRQLDPLWMQTLRGAFFKPNILFLSLPATDDRQADFVHITEEAGQEEGRRAES